MHNIFINLEHLLSFISMHNMLLTCINNNSIFPTLLHIHRVLCSPNLLFLYHIHFGMPFHLSIGVFVVSCLFVYATRNSFLCLWSSVFSIPFRSIPSSLHGWLAWHYSFPRRQRGYILYRRLHIASIHPMYGMFVSIMEEGS